MNEWMMKFTDQSLQQFEVLLSDVQVETTVAQIHFGAAHKAEVKGHRGNEIQVTCVIN